MPGSNLNFTQIQAEQVLNHAIQPQIEFRTVINKEVKIIGIPVLKIPSRSRGSTCKVETRFKVCYLLKNLVLEGI